MNSYFCCPKCKTELTATASGHMCQNCKSFYAIRDGIVDFIAETEFYAGEVSKKEFEILLEEIKSLGYQEGITQFFIRNPSLRDYVTNPRRIDWVAHCLTKNNLRCLDIGSGLGNISENLSHIYQEVYSLEAVRERIEFQKIRYKNSNRTNIVIVRGNALELPFPDDFFDLVVCNGVLEWVGTMNPNVPPRQAQILFLREVKRVLSKNGCLYIGIENRFGFPSFLGAKDHSGLPYTNLLPRWLANLIVKNFGYSGGAYGDKSYEAKKEERGYHTYTYSIWGFKSLFKEAGFTSKSFWVFPSYNQPYYSGRIEDKIGLKSFLRYFGSRVTRFKTLFPIIDKLGKHLIGLIASLLSQSFLFYCYKNDPLDSVDDIITNNARLENFTTISEGNDIMYLIYGKTGRTEKIAHFKRFGHTLPTVLSVYDKTSPNPQRAKDRIWLEKWIPGNIVDPLKLEEVNAAINWLMDFQNRTRRSNMNSADILREVNSVRELLPKIDGLNQSKYVKWLDNYQNYMQTLKIHKTDEHGDFFLGNILFDHSTNKITAIDWENYVEGGNPLSDFIFFIISIIMFSGDAEQFQANLSGNGTAGSTIKEIKMKMNGHFGFEINLDILIRFIILRFITRKYLESGPYDNTLATYRKIIETLS